MAYDPSYQSPSPGHRNAPEEYWMEVESLGIHDLVKLADASDFVGVTEDGDYVRVPDPPRHRSYELGMALHKLTVRCRKLYN